MQLSTKDYSLFSYINSNREVIPGHVEKIKKSIQEKNLLKQNPITVNTQLQVIDGQHRLEAAKQLGLDIFYNISDEVTNDDIARLNTNKRNWLLTDYLNYHFTEGKEDYKKVMKFIRENPKISLTGAMAMLSANGTTKEFKDGTFTVRSKDDADTLAEQLKELSKYGKHVYSTSFIRFYVQITEHEKFEFKKLIHQINKAPKNFVPCLGMKHYFGVIEEIYNRDIVAQNRVYFK